MKKTDYKYIVYIKNAFKSVNRKIYFHYLNSTASSLDTLGGGDGIFEG
jgi:hypothetical protein